MAGVMMTGDEGREVSYQTVPAIGGLEGRSGLVPEAQTSKVVASAHLTDGPGAEGAAYPETPGVGPYPAPTDVGEANNPLKP